MIKLFSFFIGPILGGWTYDRLGPASLWFGCFALGCLLALAYLALAGPAHRRLAGAAANED